jgi:glycosyltransferase involved in cell wall biosynthesis
MCVSIFIQTLNEEKNLPMCLDSIKWSDDIVVLDSYSSDRTEQISKEYGCRFYQRKYDGRANNQNWAVENIDFKHPWVWYVDADEVTPQELKDEIISICSNPNTPEVVYRVRFKNILMDKWLKRSSLYPTWVPRLFKPDKIRWERPANPVAIVDGSEGKLKHHFLHYTFNKGFFAWFEKHNKYSTYEAEETIKELDNGKIDWGGLFSSDVARKRQALKKLSFRLPGRAFLKFLFMYVIKLGFLDGIMGLTYCLLTSIYEYMIVLKVKEMRRRNRGLGI